MDTMAGSRINMEINRKLLMNVFRNGNGAGQTTNNATSNTKQSSSSSSRQLARSSRARIMRTTSVRNSATGTQSGGSSTSRGTGVIIGSGSSGRSLVTGTTRFIFLFDQSKQCLKLIFKICQHPLCRRNWCHRRRWFCRGKAAVLLFESFR